MSYLLKNPIPKNTMIAKISSSSNATSPISASAGSFKISFNSIIQTSTYGDLTLSSGDIILSAGRYMALFKMDLRTDTGITDSIALSYSAELKLNGTKVNDLDVKSYSSAAPVNANCSLGIAYFTASANDVLSMYINKSASSATRIYFQNLGGIVLIRTSL